ncbi:MAG: C4-type zinc ribbon domain-containing protein [Campylobacterota bacterium]|nr:C4-type zinc ribbon domain-containing protein [Campylobacterota bacterium]
MNNDLVELIKLSDIDKSIDSFLPKIEAANKKLANAQEKLDKVAERMDATKALIEQNETKVDEFESQLEMLSDQLKDITKKSKSVTTEKEVKALTLEEDIAKEKMTFANEEIERLQEVSSKKSEELEELQAEVDKEQELVKQIAAEVQETNATIDNKKAELYGKREDCVINVKPNVLQFYEKIRMWARNSAIVPIRKQACYGCFLKINDKTYAEVIKSQEIITCPHCGRILYIEPQMDEEE